MDEHGPDAAPDGAPTSSPRHPSAVIAASASLPPYALSSRVPARQGGLRALLDSALDGLDALADRIAEAAGLR